LTTDTAKKRRVKRGVASDEAHAWARSLPLNNPNGKTVLRALALYVNGEGCCFVGIDQLGEDTDLSPDTVRRRLVWLEQVGAIVRLPQWLDANGVRNGEGRGKRTSDEIRLLLEADQDEIESRALGNEIADNSAISTTETTEISPSTVLGLSDGEKTVSPALGVGQPLQSCEGLISEPEPESSPQPPSGGSVAVPDGWKEFEADWSEPILRQSLAQQVWSVLNTGQRDLARRAARGYRIWRAQQKRPPNVLSAHLFLKETDAWQKFADLAPGGPSASVAGIDVGSPEGRAVLAMHAISRTVRPFESRGRIVYRGEITPQVLALGDVEARALWIEDRQQIAAWMGFLRKHISNMADPVHSKGIGSEQRRGMYAPHPWPPRADGTWSTAPPSDVLMTDQDLADFK
jgi:hypothetical protein